MPHHPFTPVAAVPVDPRRARVHEEGWQSWSPSGTYALDADPYRPTDEPDCLMARPAVETRERWAAHVEATGGLMASSDRLLSLDPWGVETTRRLLSGGRR